MSTHQSLPRALDVRNILETPLRQFAPWLVMVVVVSSAGYPGVVCVTPMAWLIALRVGALCDRGSRSELSSHRLWEAALAGGLLGFLQGVLFAIVVPFMGPVRDDEAMKSILLTVGIIVVGIFAGACLSLFTAYLSEQRRTGGSNK
jgi:MFS family permease